MTRRENLSRALRGEPTEWVPICGHCDPYNQPSHEGMDPALAAKLATVKWGDESSIHLSRALGIEVMDWFSGSPAKVTRRRVTTERQVEGSDTILTWHTPAGDLRETLRQCREDGTSYRVEHALKTVDDLPRLAAVFDDEEAEFSADHAARVRARLALIGDDGILGQPLPSTPLGMLVRRWAGVEATILLSVDAPAAFRDLLAAMERRHLEDLRFAAATAADALITVDDTSTTTISPAMFAEHCVAYTDRAADIAHAGGKLYLHHSCGHIRDLLPIYRRTRMDVVHAFTIPPIGNVTVREGRALLGDRIGIYAGLSQLFGPLDDWDAVAASVREMIAGAGPGARGLVLGLGADPLKSMAQTQRLVDIARQAEPL